MVLNYDKEDYRPSIVSAHGLKREAVVEQTISRNYTGPEVELTTQTFSNVMVDTGETFEVLSSEGEGLLHNLEIVVDNPYAAVYLELDGYRNTEDGVGETPAELLLNNRTTRVDGQFWVKTIASDGTYTMMYTPMTPEAYRGKIRIQIANRIRASMDVYGFTLSYTSRGGIPTPSKCDFMGGGTFAHTGLKEANMDTIASAVAKPIGASIYSVDDTYNQSVFSTNSNVIGSGHPYQGQAGRPSFTINADFDATQGTIEFAAVGSAGADANSVAGPALLASSNFPGTPSRSSYQNCFIYKDTSKDVTEVATLNFDEATGVLVNGAINAGASTTITVDTVDATTKFIVGDSVLDDTGQFVGTITSVSATSIELVAANVPALANNENLRRKTATIPKIGDRIFFRNKGTVYFPGVVAAVYRYNRSGDTGTDGWTSETTANYGDSTGAHCFQVSPGLRSVPSVFSKTSDGTDETISFGVVNSNADSNPKIFVKNILVKRQVIYPERK